MNQDKIIAHVTAQEEGLPAHKIAGYLLELVEKLKTHEDEDAIEITTFCNQGHAAILPDRVRSVFDVYADGAAFMGTMSQDDAMIILGAFPDDYLTEYNPATQQEEVLTDDNGAPLEE